MRSPGETLREVLGRSRDLGFLGPREIEPQIVHAQGFIPAVQDVAKVLDLGSGGGLPGLVLALACPDTEFSLVDSQERRCTFLASAVAQLAVTDRVSVVHGRAEDLAREANLRGCFDLVVSRSFGPPAVTAECAVGFLTGKGARIAVSEPPHTEGTAASEDSSKRWPAEGLAQLGLVAGPILVGSIGSIQILELVSECPEQFPRRVGVPSKRPLF